MGRKASEHPDQKSTVSRAAQILSTILKSTTFVALPQKDCGTKMTSSTRSCKCMLKCRATGPLELAACNSYYFCDRCSYRERSRGKFWFSNMLRDQYPVV